MGRPRRQRLERRLISVREAAVRDGVSPYVIRRRIKVGQLQAVKLGPKCTRILLFPPEVA